MNSTEILEKLIAFETISARSNRPLIDWVAAYLRDLGATVDLIEQDDKASLWARLGPAAPGGVALAGHTDVVPVEGQNWTTDPFCLTAREGRLYGRGACDMKGFLACALAFAPLAAAQTLQKPLYIGLTFDEEITMAGAKMLGAWLAARALRPDWFWVGEPTEMRIVNAHKGVLACHTHITGVAAHGSQPHKGVSAVHLAAQLALWLETRAMPEYQGSPFVPPRTTFSVGKLEGGKAINIIPDHCTMEWEARLHPGDEVQRFWTAYEAEVETLLAPRRAQFPAIAIETETAFFAPPFANSSSETADAQIRAITGQTAMETVSYATEASFYSALGCPAYICGPGSIDQAHKPDEYVASDQLALCDQALLRLLPFLTGSA